MSGAPPFDDCRVLLLACARSALLVHRPCPPFAIVSTCSMLHVLPTAPLPANPSLCVLSRLLCPLLAIARVPCLLIRAPSFRHAPLNPTSLTALHSSVDNLAHYRPSPTCHPTTATLC